MDLFRDSFAQINIFILYILSSLIPYLSWRIYTKILPYNPVFSDLLVVHWSLQFPMQIFFLTN